MAKTNSKQIVLMDKQGKYLSPATTSDITVTTEDITIAGGPLADNFEDNSNDVWPESWKNSDNAKIIPAGTSIQEVLTYLFLKETQGTITWGVTNAISPSIVPSCYVKLGDNELVDNSYIENGTVVEFTYDKATILSGTTSESAYIKVGVNPNYVFSDTTYALNVDKVENLQTRYAYIDVTSVTYSLISGKCNDTVVNNQSKNTIGLGSYIFTVSEPNVAYTIVPSSFTEDTYYACTNTKKKGSNRATIQASTKGEGYTVTNYSKSKIIKGYNPVFWGFSNTCGLTTTSEWGTFITNKDNMVTFTGSKSNNRGRTAPTSGTVFEYPVGVGTFFIAYPEIDTNSVKAASSFTLKSAAGMGFGTFNKVTNVSVKLNDNATDVHYTVLFMSNADPKAASDKVTLTI